jgi:5-oxoprolinase (ATP-hydrolysing)
MRVGTDAGGTFTDLVTESGEVVKVPSDRLDPAAAVRAALAEVEGSVELLAHGTTVATNALLERRGAAVALVTNRGLEDVIEIGRQDRPSLYDPFVDRPEPLVPRQRRVGVPGRLGAAGEEIEPLGGVPAIGPEVEAVAVCLLHSDLAPAHEAVVAATLRAAGHDVSASHEVAPEFREYERAVTTVANAYLRPVCRHYLASLASCADEVLAMTSAGGLVPVGEGAESPVRLLLSGPAGGVLAGAAVAAACGYPDAVTFDMGGTSTDVCLVLGGIPAPAAERSMEGLAIRVPSLDVLTIGAGGGSIASLDPGGALVVGPRSAGATPGPVCYGRGGTEPTVTDADLVLGRIDPAASLPGLGPLAVDAARAALHAVGVSAAAVVAVVDAAMERALRRVTVERGVDPRGLALVAFGGAGPLHACALAEALGMAAVIVPDRAGVLSAVGILGAPRQHAVVRSWPTPLEHDGLEAAVAALATLAATGLGPDASVTTAVDCRYLGQSHELTVAKVADFEAEHERRNGYRRRGDPVEVVALRATAVSAVPALSLPPRRRPAAVVGPATVVEADCTIWVPAGWRADPGPAGALVLTRTGDDGRDGPEHLDDSANLAVLAARLGAVVDEMDAVLRRAAFSPNIKERADHSVALFTPAGELLAQAANIPVHLGAMPASVRAVIERCGTAVHAGEQCVVNDPFAGGTHLNDVTVVAPCFVADRLVGWAANRAHHADVGGAVPGSLPPDARTIHEEGIRLAPMLLTEQVREIFVANSRTPEERRGDLDAQVGANAVGVRGLAALAGEPLEDLLDHGERRMRAALAALPDGGWHASDSIDSHGGLPDQRAPGRVCVAVRIHGDEITFDFTGTDPQGPGSVNAVEAVTVSCVGFALRAATDPAIPLNGGALRPVRIVAPPGSLVAARFPAAVGAGNVELSQRLADVCLAALAGVAPDRVGAASQGTMNNVLLGGDTWVYYETVAGGQGGRPGPRPGMSGVHTAMTNTKNTPIEALERAFPLRVLRQRLRRGSGGAGSAPGGEGIERDLQMLTDATVSLITERRVSQPWGLAGGEPGAVGENWLLPGGDPSRSERLADKCTIQLKEGDVLRMLTPGGGGWGDPAWSNAGTEAGPPRDG